MFHFHNKEIHSDPLKKKGLVVAYMGKDYYNVHCTIVHFALCLPLNSANLLPLSSNTLDSLTKYYQQLHILLINEASLIGVHAIWHTWKISGIYAHTYIVIWEYRCDILWWFVPSTNHTWLLYFLTTKFASRKNPI